MTKKRHQYSTEFKFKVALEAAKGTKTISDLASETGVHPTQISDWKRQLLEEGTSLFQRNRKANSASTKRCKLNSMSRLAVSRWNWSG